MGWWDCGIMGGDTPLDYQYSIHEILGVGQDAEPTAEQIPDAKLRDIIRHAEADGWLECDPWIFWEVLAVTVMGAGAAMPDDIRAKAMSAADDEIANGCEDWKKPDDRRARLAEFREAVESYDGTPVIIGHTGLMEKMMNLLEGEDDGTTPRTKSEARAYLFALYMAIEREQTGKPSTVAGLRREIGKLKARCGELGIDLPTVAEAVEWFPEEG